MKSFFKFVKKNYAVLLGLIPIILAIIDYFFKWQIFIAIWNFLKLIYQFILRPVGQDLLTRPYLIIFILILSFAVFFIWRRLKIVAGEFKEDFKKGLSNWEYDDEGWKIEKGEDGLELSVSNSGDGGITNFGIWDDFIFAFDCKIISKNVGWIIRARDRVNYFYDTVLYF